jgi:hypothetical protein
LWTARSDNMVPPRVLRASGNVASQHIIGWTIQNRPNSVAKWVTWQVVRSTLGGKQPVLFARGSETHKNGYWRWRARLPVIQAVNAEYFFFLRSECTNIIKSNNFTHCAIVATNPQEWPLNAESIPVCDVGIFVGYNNSTIWMYFLFLFFHTFLEFLTHHIIIV